MRWSSIESFLVLAMVMTSVIKSLGDPLTEGVRKGSGYSFLEAGNSGRKDLIPLIEQYLQSTRSSPSSADYIAAQQALAQLGVKKYWNEIIGELTNPVSSSAFQYEMQSRESTRAHLPPTVTTMWAVRSVQIGALHKLSEINHSAAVKFIAPFLDDQQPLAPAPHPGASGPIAVSAAWALSKMRLQNPPLSDNDFLVWQRWWEQHKDYYEKVEFGKSLPPLPAPSVPSVSSPQKTNPISPPLIPPPTSAELAAPAAAWLYPLIIGGVVLGGLVAWLLVRWRRSH